MAKKTKQTTKLCYMDTHSYIVYLKTGERHLFRHFKRCQNKIWCFKYELDRPLLKGKNKIVTGLIKDKLSEKTITKFAAFRPKTCNYLTDDSDNNKKVKSKESVSQKDNLNLSIINIV